MMDEAIDAAFALSRAAGELTDEDDDGGSCWCWQSETGEPEKWVVPQWEVLTQDGWRTEWESGVGRQQVALGVPVWPAGAAERQCAAGYPGWRTVPPLFAARERSSPLVRSSLLFALCALRFAGGLRAGSYELGARSKKRRAGC